MMIISIYFIGTFKKIYLFIFRERGREGGREGEQHQCVVASYVGPWEPTGDLTHNQTSALDWESNWQPFDSQAGTQTLSHMNQGLLVLF